jgi:diguanylate cyclase (GGDEF)-like protein
MVVAGMLLAYVRRAAGKQAVRAILAEAGEASAAFIDPFAWIELPRLERLSDAASRILGTEAAVGRGIAIEIMRWHQATGETDAWRALGAFGVLDRFAAHSMRQYPGLQIDVEADGETSALVRVTYTGGTRPLRLFCDLHGEIWQLALAAAGEETVVSHPDCATRGAEECRFVVRWSHVAGTYGDFEPAALVQRLQDAARRLALCSTEADVYAVAIAAVRDVIVPGPFAYALVIDHDGDVRTQSSGFDNDAAEVAALGRLDAAGEVVEDAWTAIVVPLDSGTRDYGLLAGFFPAGFRTTVRDRALLEAYGSHVAAAIESKRILARAERDRDDLAAMLGLSRDLSLTTSPRGILDLVETTIRSLIGLDGAVAVALNRASDNVEADATGDALAIRLGMRLDADGGLPERVDTTAGDALVVPMTVNGDVVGAVVVPEATSSASALQRIRGIANQGALALHATRLLATVKHQATHDHLTGLPNRLLLRRRLDDVVASSGGDRSAALLFVDLDHFKQINDSIGHNGGDAVLAEVARRLAEVVRSTDTVARVGGDEFVILLTDVTKDAAARVAAEARQAIAQPLILAGERVALSATIGVALATACTLDWDQLLTDADSAMYAGKRAGRGRVAVA